MINFNIKLVKVRDQLWLLGLAHIKNREDIISTGNLKIDISGRKYNIYFPFKCFTKNRFMCKLSNLYLVKIPINDVINEKINNKLFYVYNENNREVKKKVRYSIKNRNIKFFNSSVYKIRKINTSIYLRQNENNSAFITVRKINITDNILEQIKINTAYFISKFSKRKNILLYEKEASRYEESASVLYETLIDNGNKNVFFIIDKECSDISNINKKYRNNIIYKNTFKHYLYFFNAKTLIGTELMGHAIELRIANKYAIRKMYEDKLNFVFLQHGVTYMVPLNAKTRIAFRKTSTNGLRRIVVSSQLEADHYINEGNYDYKDMYISGLAKFDRNKWNQNANKIIIMLTWRPWEYNQSRIDFTSTNYYKMMKRIFSTIPKEYKENTIILPHPLLSEFVDSIDCDMKKYMNFEDKYDDLLKDAKVLITDYSSISYDAFYRGSNVIFYWEEKDYCMNEYGEGTKLMLNEDNCFGDICYNTQELKQVIQHNYLGNQNDEYIKRYRKIVEFHDGKNTERLIQYLKNDNLI